VLFSHQGSGAIVHFQRDGVAISLRDREGGGGDGLGRALPGPIPGDRRDGRGAAGPERITLGFRGANPLPRVQPGEELDGRVNYLVGDPEGWRTSLPAYGDITYRELYPGVDLRFHGDRGELEYDLTVRPGADLSRVCFTCGGARLLRLNEAGELEMELPRGRLVQRMPAIFQEEGDQRRPVQGRFVLDPPGGEGPAGGEVGYSFAVAARDPARTLVIDPVLDFSTYYGGRSLDQAEAVAVDGAGNVYLAGWSWSDDLVPPSWQRVSPGREGSVTSVWGRGGDDLYVSVQMGDVCQIRHYDGAAWEVVAAPGFSVADLWGTPDGHLFAVGSGGGVLHFDGTAWTRMDAGPGEDLSAVWGAAADDLFAVGSWWGGIHHFDGTAWTRMETGISTPLYGIWGSSAADVFAVGYDAILHYDGLAWRTMPAGGATLRDVWGASGTDVFAAGAGGAVLHYDGSAWQPLETGTTDDFHALWGFSGEDVYVVGSTFPAVIIRHYDGSSWEDTSAGPTSRTVDLHDIWGSSPDALFAVGQGGRVLRRDPDAPPALFPAGHNDGFVAKLDSTGQRLLFVTYLGGNSDDRITGLAVDHAGNVHLTGDTLSTDFPLANPFQPGRGGRSLDAFVARIDASGRRLVYSSYLGGRAGDSGYGIALDGAGNALVAGETSSPDFPVRDALLPTRGGRRDGFVAKVDPAGSLVYATYLGGRKDDVVLGVAADGEGYAGVTGWTTSRDFPLSRPLFGSYRGGDWDSFLARLAPDGRELVFATYFGGSRDDTGTAVAADPRGNLYVAGYTHSPDFPLKNPVPMPRAGHTEAFVTKMRPDGSALVYSTLFRGSWTDRAYDIAVDPAGRAYVTGETWSRDLPMVRPLFPSHGGAETDAFLVKLAASGRRILHSTYLGGSKLDMGFGVAADASGTAYVAGYTESPDFPVLRALHPARRGSRDAFVVKVAR
jgi:hypothetical protein